MAEGFLAALLVLDNDLDIDLFDDEDNFEADLIADDTLELLYRPVGRRQSWSQRARRVAAVEGGSRSRWPHCQRNVVTKK
jgi:hypothetical protein